MKLKRRPNAVHSWHHCPRYVSSLAPHKRMFRNSVFSFVSLQRQCGCSYNASVSSRGDVTNKNPQEQEFKWLRKPRTKLQRRPQESVPVSCTPELTFGTCVLIPR